MTERYNRVAKIVKDAVVKYVGRKLRSDIHENTTIPEVEGRQELRRLRPGMTFRRSTTKGEEMEILEFSCPYGHMSHKQDMLRAVYDRKMAKYREFRDEIRSLTRQPVNLTSIIVSSMGDVYGPSLKALKTILGSSDGELQTLERRMSDAAITCSLNIWREIAGEKTTERTTDQPQTG
jgi:hypothetical protein